MKVIVDGLAIEYHDQGQGPVVVLLHGWGVNATTFDQLANSLTAKFRVIRPDLPGFGNSEQPPVAWGVRHYADFVSRFLSKVGVSGIELLAGHSFGGRIAIKAVASRDLTPHKLILIDAAGVAKTSSLRNKAFLVAAKTGKFATSILPSSLRQQLRQKLYQAAGSTDYLNAGPMKQILVKTVTEDLRDDTKLIDVPTLIIWGADDTETPVEDGRKLAYGIKAVKFEAIARAGHFVYLDQPRRFLGLMENFLAV